jgi:hypothetical protein
MEGREGGKEREVGWERGGGSLKVGLRGREQAAAEYESWKEGKNERKRDRDRERQRQRKTETETDAQPGCVRYRERERRGTRISPVRESRPGTHLEPRVPAPVRDLAYGLRIPARVALKPVGSQACPGCVSWPDSSPYADGTKGRPASGLRGPWPGRPSGRRARRPAGASRAQQVAARRPCPASGRHGPTGLGCAEALLIAGPRDTS